MNSRASLAAHGVLLLLFCSCEEAASVSIPTFSDGGLLRTGIALSREQLYAFEGMFDVEAGSGLFGKRVAVRSSSGTVSVLTDKDAAFSVLGAACLPGRRVVLEGYWQYPTRAMAGLLRVFVDDTEQAAKLCEGRVLESTKDLRLRGYYGHGDDFPRTPILFGWSRALEPWRGRFFTVAHHGACENTDSCGATPNSLESLRLAERVGANAAEVDVRLTRDGVPILFHDPTLSRSLVRGLFCNGKVADLSLAELRASCQLLHGETIPTLEEALAMMIDETELEGAYLDIKVPEAVLPVSRIVVELDELLRARNANDDPDDDRQFAALVGIPTEEIFHAWGSAKATLEKEKRALPACLIEYDPDLVIAEGCVAWGPTWTSGPQVDEVRKVQAAGALTVFWTINQSEFIDEFLLRAHPNGIISSRTALLFYRYQTIGTPPAARAAQGETP